MMKKIIITFCFSILYGMTIFAQTPKVLPAFESFKRYDDGTDFTIDSLSLEGKNVLVFYDPGCGHCQELGYHFSENWEKWDKKVTFYFISMTEKEFVDGYVNQFAPNLKDKKNVIFLYDEIGEFITLFDPQNFPSTYIYDGETKNLIEMYDGENDTGKMKKHLSSSPKAKIK